MAARTMQGASTGSVKRWARGGHGDRFGLLLGVLVGTYVLSAFTSGNWVRAVQVALFLVVVLLAVRTSRLSRTMARLAIIIVLGGTVIALVLALIASTGPAAGLASAWMALMLLFAVVLIVGRVLATREVTTQSIFGAISAYMVIGLMFAAGYAAISKFGDGAFFAQNQPSDTKTFQYFSFATLTTVGYGDFTAAGSGGRAVAVMEAMLGQIFLATLVARLVSAYRTPTRPGRARPDRAGRDRAGQDRRPRPAPRQNRRAAIRPSYQHRWIARPRPPGGTR